MSDNNEITRIIEKKNINTFTGIYREKEGIRYFDAETVNGEELNIPDIWLFGEKESSRQSVGVAKVREDRYEEILSDLQDGDRLIVKGILGINKRTSRKVIYLSDKNTVLGPDEETVERFEKDPPKYVKRPIFLCKVAGVMSRNEDGVSRQGILRGFMNEYGENDKCSFAGKLVRTEDIDSGKRKIDVLVKNKKIGYVPDDAIQQIEENKKTKTGSVLVWVAYWSEGSIYSAKLYEPTWEVPTDSMVYRVNKILEEEPSLIPPEEITYSAYSHFLDEHMGNKTDSPEDEKMTEEQKKDWNDEYRIGKWIDGSGNEYWVRYKKTFDGHTFSEEENERLLRGETITISCNERDRTGRLQKNESSEGKSYFGFTYGQTDLDDDESIIYDDSLFPEYIRRKNKYIQGIWIDGSGNGYWVRYKRNYAGHTFSGEENERLLRGETITISCNGVNRTGRLQKYKSSEGKSYFGFTYDQADLDNNENIKYDPSLFPKFIQDMNKERLIHLFVENHYYSKLENSDGTRARVEYYYDQLMQKNGVDLILSIDNEEYIIDEKSQTDSIFKDEPKPSFALELLNSNSNNIGWFVNDVLRTEYYMFFWPHADEKPAKFGSVEDVKYIEYVDYALVNRNRLKEYILEHYCGTEALLDYAHKLSNGELEKTEEKDKIIKYKEKPFDDKVYLTYSYTLKEKPVNLVVKREIIEQISPMKHGRLKR